MIIGNGLIAQSLQFIDKETHLFFASGVSNSLETRSSEFEREFILLKNSLEEYPDARLVYFSTLSINDQSKQDSHYVLHKLKLEEYIRNHASSHLILRIGNIVGNGGNPNTLFNFLKTRISHGETFTIHQRARRLLLDIDDVSKFLQVNGPYLNNQIINFAYPYYFDLKEIVQALETRMQKKAIYREADEGDFYKVDFDETANSFFNGINADDYLRVLAGKYI
ncbi:NAD(P)-dependent oxidoreductase [Chryseobacterium hagamense]|uniref:NAD-dependent epimerase/dehydratase domain-containing protein n=1 Tax=Chryseobacterium hagamense TaxID=395935 RepID=A0A511YII1_9FLAO|nr:NAD(P)-dependent oxidoreductase [Chryseobacterium hagamense]GEN74956.1 hypothetical protein CHA01nite_06960 [Chryseobacterium hagamense]